MPAALPRLLLAAALLGACLVPPSAGLSAEAPEPRSTAAVAGAAATPKVGRDISWPNCPKGMGIPSRRTLGLPMPSASSKLVVVGLTNGPGFTPNPCLESQVAWVRAHHVYAAPYAFTTYPTAAQRKTYATAGPYDGNTVNSKLRNTGYAQAQFNVTNLKAAGLHASFIWVDVEPSRAPAPWSTSTSRNKAVVDGALRGYRDAGLQVGVYSTRALWQELVGDARYALPEWRTVGPATKAKALKMCGQASFQGGEAVLAQWWTDTRDYDVTCPAYSSKAQLKRFFVKY